MPNVAKKDVPPQIDETPLTAVTPDQVLTQLQKITNKAKLYLATDDKLPRCIRVHLAALKKYVDWVSNLKIEDASQRKRGADLIFDAELLLIDLELAAVALEDDKTDQQKHDTIITAMQTDMNAMQTDMNAMQTDMKNMRADLLYLRLDSDLVFIGEAASILLDPNKKPKHDIVPDGEIPITWNKNPNKSELPPLSPTFRSDLEVMRDVKNSISHSMKRKRNDADFLKTKIQSVLDIKKQLADLNETRKRDVDPSKIFTILGNKKKQSVFLINGPIM